MKDEKTLAELLRATAADPLGPVNPDTVVARGERSLRRRRWSTVAAAGLTVGAVVLAATLLPDLGSTSSGEPAPASQAPTMKPSLRLTLGGARSIPENGRFGRIELGSAADRPLRLLSAADAATRCRQQWSALAGRDVGPVTMKPRFFVFDLADRPFGLTPAERAPFEAAQRLAEGKQGIRQPLEWYGYWPGTPAPVADRAGKTFTCMIPGSRVPSAAELAEDRQGSIPADDAGLLRRCSTIFWHDFSGWRVTARQVEPGVAASLVATSPSGKLAVRCVVTDPSLRTSATGLYSGPLWRSMISGTRVEQRLDLFGVGLAGGGTWSCAGDCAGWLFKSAGRLPANVAKLVVRTPQGRTVETPVHDGWYALAFAHRDRSEQKRSGTGTLTAHDAGGKKLGSTEYQMFTR